MFNQTSEILIFTLNEIITYIFFLVKIFFQIPLFIQIKCFYFALCR